MHHPCLKPFRKRFEFRVFLLFSFFRVYTTCGTSHLGTTFSFFPSFFDSTWERIKFSHWESQLRISTENLEKGRARENDKKWRKREKRNWSSKFIHHEIGKRGLRASHTARAQLIYEKRHSKGRRLSRMATTTFSSCNCMHWAYMYSVYSVKEDIFMIMNHSIANWIAVPSYSVIVRPNNGHTPARYPEQISTTHVRT